MRSLLAIFLGCLCLAAQTVQESFARDPGPLDFICGEGHEQDIMQSLAGDALVGIDAEGRVVPRLAERWIFRKNVLQLALRKDATFPDGSPVRADDVIWTFREIQRRNDATPTKRSIVEGLDVRGSGHTLEMRFSWGVQRLLLEIARIPVARKGHSDVGSGPFELRKANGEWLFVARPHFLHPKIQAIRFRLIPDEQAVLQNLQKGWLHLGVPPTRHGLRPPDTCIEVSHPAHFQLIVWSRVGLEPLKRLETWRSDAFPPGILGSKARPSRGLWPETLGFPLRRIATELAPSTQTKTWELLYAAGDETVQRMLMALSERAKRDGVGLVLKPVESALLYERLVKGQFQLACAVNVFDPHPWSVLDLLLPKGALNFAQWQHPKLAQLLPKLESVNDPAWDELQRVWAEAPTSIPLLDFSTLVWVDRHLKVTPSSLGLYLTTPGAAGWSWVP